MTTYSCGQSLDRFSRLRSSGMINGMDPTPVDLDRLPADLPVLKDQTGVWTRGDLRLAVNSAHAYFSENGIGPGDRVAVLTGPDKRLIAALLGARAAGAMACPVDPTGPAPLLARLDPRLVISVAPQPEARAIDVDVLLAARPGPGATGADGSGRVWGVATSGSAGHPRIVVLTEPSVAHVTATVQKIVGYRPGDMIHGGLPLHHTYGLSQLWLAMASGACLFLPSVPLNERNLSAWLGDATVLPTFASRLRLLMDLGYRPRQRLITLAGENADPGMRELFSRHAGDTRFILFYGLTEATTRVLWLGHDEFFGNPQATGRPIAGVRTWLDDDGEMWVDGPNVAAGYWADPEATASRFPGGRLRTGDSFEFDGRLYYFRGRKDGVFKRFGEKVIPELVESALGSHPDVSRCLVAPDPDRRIGSEPAPVAWVVARGAARDPRSLIGYQRTRLPAVMVPTRIHFVSSLATTSSGKLIRTPPL